MFRGSITALVTPFRNGALDEAALRRLLARQLEAGSRGLVPCGTTGESPTLTDAEWERVIALCLEEARGKAPVIAGCGTNATATTVARAKRCAGLKADGLLVVAPYYNKPTQEGLYRHFRAVAEATPLPILIYNIPGRTAVDVLPTTLGRLARDCKTIVGVKDATGDLSRVGAQTEACGKSFVQLSGDDVNALAFNQSGGKGCVSVASNVVPDLCVFFQDLCAGGKWDEAAALHERLSPLYGALFVETNPGPVKYALSRLGLCEGDVRLPLVELAAASQGQVDAALKGLNLPA
jgi:4-hydroxy-tetrahydrodipicolinate synthase